MVAVSNTSPLRYLIAAGHADILHRLFGQVLVPQGVADEMCDRAAPASVRKWILSPPAWLNILAVSFPPDESLLGLDRGEREAIQLALERKADILIMDEWKGRTVVQRLGPPLTGALACWVAHISND